MAKLLTNRRLRVSLDVVPRRDSLENQLTVRWRMSARTYAHSMNDLARVRLSQLEYQHAHQHQDPKRPQTEADPIAGVHRRFLGGFPPAFPQV